MKCPTFASGLRFAAFAFLYSTVAVLAPAQSPIAPPSVSNTFGSATVALSSPASFSGRGSVSGTVFDELGHPVANARVILTSASVFGGGGTASTDAQGHYSFPGVAVGTFSMNANF